MKNAPIGLSIACRSPIFLTNEYKLKIDGMKNLQLTDTERHFLIHLLNALLDSESTDPNAGKFPADYIHIKTILSKLSSKNG
jgi:hypothetical protein